MNDDEQLIDIGTNDLNSDVSTTHTVFERLLEYAVISADLNGNIIACNGRASSIYGYDGEEIIGKERIGIFFPGEFIEAGMLDEILNNLRRDESYSYEGEKVQKSGTVFPAQLLFIPTKW